MKKIISVMLIVAFLMTGCMTVKEHEAEGEQEASKSKVGGTITVVTSRTDADDLFVQIEEAFKELYPEVEDIIWQSAADYDSSITTRMNTKDYGDVLFVPFSMAGNPSEYPNYFEPLGTVDELSPKYFDVTEADYDSTVYGLPVALNSLGIIYNENVLIEAGIDKMPTSLEEMIAVCEKIKENTDAIPFYTNYNTTLGVWAGAMTSYGGEQYKSDTLAAGTAFQEGQPMREIMDLFYELSSRGFTEADPITGDYGKSLQMLADGQVAMLMMGDQEAKQIQNMTDTYTIKIMPFPVTIDGQTSIPIGAPAVIGINKNSSNIATSKAFLEFFVSKASGYANDLGGISPNKEDLNEEEKVLFENNNVILTVPTETPETDELYNKIANEVGVGRLTDVLQQTINTGLYPDQNKSYEDFTTELENSWSQAIKNNE